MKINGKLIKGVRIAKEANTEIVDEKLSYTELLEQCLIKICGEMDIPVPLWLKKNTKEFVRYRKTSFSNEQFVEKISFDRFEIKVEE